ncbi:MAG: hypothetical protein JNM43_25315 [Planctomycetaceae bacterium]|nr:hypothetical protein [Planctomycetaceae bacterium]
MLILTLSVLLLSRLATQSLRLATQLRAAEQRLQQDWAVWSAITILLGRAESVLAEADAREGKSATSRVLDLSLGEAQLRVVVTDESALLNVNSLRATLGSARAAGLVRKYSDELEAAELSSRFFAEAVDGKTFDSFVDVFRDAAEPQQLKSFLQSPDRQLTCWGSGRLNYQRASHELLLELASAYGHRGLMTRFLRAFDAEPTASFDAIVKKAKLTDEERLLLASLTQPASTSWSISVIAGNERTVFVVREADEGAIRGKIHSSRLR